MRALATLALLARLALATPHPDASTWDHSVGTATQGSRDAWEDWADAWDGDWTCTMSPTQFRYLLTMHDPAATDVLRLEATEVDAGNLPLQALATSETSAVLIARSPDGCPRFAVIGASVATAVDYEVEVRTSPWGILPP